MSLLSVLAVAGATFLLSGKIARDSQLRNAENTTERMARNLVGPLLPEALHGVPEQRELLDRVVANRLRDGTVTLIRVWTADGLILYSSDPTQVGGHEPPSPLLEEAIAGQVVSDLDEHPEQLSGGAGQPFLEVYAPMTLDGQPHAFEAYFSAADLEDEAADLRNRIVPLAVGALVVLQLLQMPFVVSLGRRLRRHEAARTRLAQSNLTASERERRTIAADVHDGPVQDLAGVSYALSGMRASLPEAQRPTVDRIVMAVRNAVASLRRLMVDIYPPDLTGSGLVNALQDLATPLREQGLTVTVEEDGMPDVAPPTAAVLYRTAKEAMVNVVRHARAQEVSICLEETTLDGSPAVRLTIADDGVGYPSPGGTALPRSSSDGDGHLGLRLVRDRVVASGGEVTLRNREGGGAVLEAVLPVQGDDVQVPPR